MNQTAKDFCGISISISTTDFLSVEPGLIPGYRTN